MLFTYEISWHFRKLEIHTHFAENDFNASKVIQKFTEFFSPKQWGMQFFVFWHVLREIHSNFPFYKSTSKARVWEKSTLLNRINEFTMKPKYMISSIKLLFFTFYAIDIDTVNLHYWLFVPFVWTNLNILQKTYEYDLFSFFTHFLRKIPLLEFWAGFLPTYSLTVPHALKR